MGQWTSPESRLSAPKHLVTITCIAAPSTKHLVGQAQARAQRIQISDRPSRNADSWREAGPTQGPVVRNGPHQDENPVLPALELPSCVSPIISSAVPHEPRKDETESVSQSSWNLDIAELEGSQRKPHYTGRKGEAHKGEETH